MFGKIIFLAIRVNACARFNINVITSTTERSIKIHPITFGYLASLGSLRSRLNCIYLFSPKMKHLNRERSELANEVSEITEGY